MRLMVRAAEGVWLLAGSQLSKIMKGGAPQAIEIKSYDRWATRFVTFSPIRRWGNGQTC
jgi:hypothetical protein